MNMRVVADTMGQHLAAIEAFAVEPVEADPSIGAGESGQQRGEARKKLEIHNGVDSSASRPRNERQRIEKKLPQRAGADEEDIGAGDRAGEGERAGVLREYDKEDFGAEPGPRLAHGRVGKNGAAHLGKLDEQDTADGPRHRW